MVRRALRLMVRLALLVGAALVVSKIVQSRREENSFAPPEPRGDPLPTAPPPVAAVRPPQSQAPKPAPPKAEPTATDLADNVVVGRSQAPPVEPWVEPDMAGLCPSSHPVKAKLSSGIYHLPGMLAYTRTRADRCYCDGEAAETDGLRKAKR